MNISRFTVTVSDLVDHIICVVAVTLSLLMLSHCPADRAAGDRVHHPVPGGRAALPLAVHGAEPHPRRLRQLAGGGGRPARARRQRRRPRLPPTRPAQSPTVVAAGTHTCIN